MPTQAEFTLIVDDFLNKATNTQDKIIELVNTFAKVTKATKTYNNMGELAALTIESQDDNARKYKTTMADMGTTQQRVTTIVTEDVAARSKQEAALERVRLATAKLKQEQRDAAAAARGGERARGVLKSAIPKDISGVSEATSKRLLRAQEQYIAANREAGASTQDLDRLWSKLVKGNLTLAGKQTVKLQVATLAVQEAVRKVHEEQAKIAANNEKANASVRAEVAARKEAAAAAKRQADEQLRISRAAAQSQRFLAGARVSSSKHASLSELTAVENANKKILDANNKIGLSTKQLNDEWRRLNNGQLVTAKGRMKVLRDAMVKLLEAQRALGNQAAKTALEQIRAADAGTRAMGRQTVATKKAEVATKSLTLSWQSMTKLMITQIASRTLFTFIAQVREATANVLKLSQSVAEIQTIDSSRTLGANEIIGELRQLSEAFGVDTIEQAEAAYQVLSNQVAIAGDNFTFLAEANKLALATLTSVDSAVLILSATINAYGKEVTETNDISSSFFKTVELGRIRLEEIANSYGKIAVPASQLGITYNELNAALAFLTVKGIKASEATTLLRAIMVKLIKPTKDMQAALEAIGFESGPAATAALGLGGTLAALQEVTKGSVTELGKLFGRIRATTGALAFAGKGMDEYNNILGQVSQGHEGFARAQELVIDSTGKRLQQQLESIKNFFEQDIAKSFLEAIRGMTDDFKLLAVGVKAISSVLGGGFVIAIGAATVALTKMAVAFSLTPFGVTVTSLTAVITTLSVLRQNSLQTAKELNAVLEGGRQASRDIAAGQGLSGSKLLAQADKDLKALSTIYAQTSATITIDIQKTLSTQSEVIEDITKVIGKLNKETADGIAKNLKDATSEVKKLEAAAVKSFDVIEKLKQSKEAKLFQFSIEGLDDEGKLQKLDERIANLRKQSEEAATAGDTKTFDALRSEIDGLSGQRFALLDETLDQQDAISIKQKEFNTLITEELKLRDQLGKQQQEAIKRANAEKAKQEQLQLRSTSITKQIGAFDLDAASSGSAEDVQKAFGDQIKLINQLKELQSSQGIEDFTQLNKLKLSLELQAEATLHDLRLKHTRDEFAEKVKNAKAAFKVETDRINREEAKAAQIEAQVGTIIEGIRLQGDTATGVLVRGLNRGAEGGTTREGTEGLLKDLVESLKLFKEGSFTGQVVANRIRGLTPTGRFTPATGIESLVSTTEENEAAEKLTQTMINLALRLETDFKGKTLQGEEARLAELRKPVEAQGALISQLAKDAQERREVVAQEKDTTLQLALAAQALKDAAAALKGVEPTPDGFAAGGFIPRGSDTVPAMLTPGEFVVNARSSKRFRSQLLAMNSGQTPSYFAGGGSVTNVGDVNVSVRSSGNTQPDIVAIGNGLHRAIRQGRMKGFS